MAIDIRTSIGSIGDRSDNSTSVVFDFQGRQVLQYIVGISYWKMSLHSNNAAEYHAYGLGMNILTSVDGDKVFAIPRPKFLSNTCDLNPWSGSSVGLTCLAVVGDDSGNVALASYNSIPSKGNSGSLWTPSGGGVGTQICEGAVLGWQTFFSSSEQFLNFQTSVSPVPIGTQFALNGTAVLGDSAGHSAVNPTVTGGLIYTNSKESGLIAAEPIKCQTSDNVTVVMSKKVSKVGVMITDCCVSYASGSQHPIYSMSGGTTGYSLGSDNQTVTLSAPSATMFNGSKTWQNNGISYVKLLVFGIPA